MSIQDITNKILSDAKAEADKIIAENKSAIEKMTKEKDEKIVEAVKNVEEKGKAKEQKVKEQAEFQCRMLEKNATLKVKQELIDQVFETTKKDLAHLDDEKFVKLMTALFKKAAKLEDAEIIASTDKKDLITKAARESGRAEKISEKHLPKGQEGFVLSSKTIEVNNTVDSLVETRREELEAEVANILYG